MLEVRSDTNDEGCEETKEYERRRVVKIRLLVRVRTRMRANQRAGERGAIVHKAGHRYQHDWPYL
jgi:hypothetical protein